MITSSRNQGEHGQIHYFIMVNVFGTIMRDNNHKLHDEQCDINNEQYIDLIMYY